MAIIILHVLNKEEPYPFTNNRTQLCTQYRHIYLHNEYYVLILLYMALVLVIMTQLNLSTCFTLFGLEWSLVVVQSIIYIYKMNVIYSYIYQIFTHCATSSNNTGSATTVRNQHQFGSKEWNSRCWIQEASLRTTLLGSKII